MNEAQASEASRLLLALARRNARVYAAHPDARAIIVTGSAAEGVSDFSSDLDMILYYDRLPSEDELLAACQQNEGKGRHLLGRAGDEEVMDAFAVNGVECQCARSLFYLIVALLLLLNEAVYSLFLAPLMFFEWRLHPSRSIAHWLLIVIHPVRCGLVVPGRFQRCIRQDHRLPLHAPRAHRGAAHGSECPVPATFDTCRRGDRCSIRDACFHGPLLPTPTDPALADQAFPRQDGVRQTWDEIPLPRSRGDDRIRWNVLRRLLVSLIPQSESFLPLFALFPFNYCPLLCG